VVVHESVDPASPTKGFPTSRYERRTKNATLSPYKPAAAPRRLELDLETCLGRAQAARLIVGIAGTASLRVYGVLGRTGHKHEPMARQTGARNGHALSIGLTCGASRSIG
jgi:hypothetical protein